MKGLMKNMPYEEAFRGSKVDFLASFSNSSNIGKTANPTHGCVDQMRSLKVLAHLPEKIRLAVIPPYPAYWNFKQGTSVMIFP